jgi:galactokinase
VIDEVRTAFRRAFAQEPAAVGAAPGRVNLIGEHVDYLGGLVLPAAVDRCLAIAVGESEAWDVRGDDRYVRAIAEELGRGPLIATIASEIPAGAGLSSSAALLVATAAALAPDLDGVDAAQLCRLAEQRASGVQVGIMDQFASALGREGCALLLDCETLAYEYVPMPAELAIAVVESGISRDLAATPYNSRRAEAEAAMAGAEGAVAERRRRHVLSELRRVRLFVAALRAGDHAELGRLLKQSHESLRDDFEVSLPEIDRLAERAWAAPGCLGARIMGGGFGGSLVSLVEASQAGDFVAAVAAPVTICRPARGAFQREQSA